MPYNYPHDPNAIRERYMRAYAAFTPPPAPMPSYNPLREALFSQVAANPSPTTSPVGAIVRGLLTGLVANKLGREKMDFAEAERTRAKAEGMAEKGMDREAAIAEWDRQQAVGQASKLGILGTESALKLSESVQDQTKFAPLTPAQRGNLETVTGLFTSNPEFRRAMETDPSFGTTAIRNVLTNPETGALGLAPAWKPEHYKDRTRNLPDGTAVQEVSMDGGRTWASTGPPAPRWEGGGGKGADLQLDKHIDDLVDGYLRVPTEVQDPMTGLTSMVMQVPPEQRRTKLLMSSMVKQQMANTPGLGAAEAAALVSEEFQQMGVLPRRDKEISSEDLYPPVPGARRGVDPTTGEMGWYEPNPAIPGKYKIILGADGALPADPTQVPAPARPGPAAASQGGVLGLVDAQGRPVVGPGHGGPPLPPPPPPTTQPFGPLPGRGRLSQPFQEAGDPLITPIPISPGVWEYRVGDRRITDRAFGGKPVKRSVLLGEPAGKKKPVAVMP